MTAFTGSALAGNGHGNDNAPGQQKQDQSVATQAPEQSAPQPQQQSAQTQSAETESGHEAPGQAKKQEQHPSVPSTQSSTQAGVKPDSTTTKWTHCTTGTSSAGATCTSSDNGHTPQPNADASKRYGNGKTAVQIAVSRGGIGVQLTGPGNSQPHKVSVCGKPNNTSGGVDVHAVKSYSNLSCAETHVAATAPVAPCGFSVVARSFDEDESEDHGEGVFHQEHEEFTTSSSLQPDSSQSCNSAATAQATPATVAPVVAPVTPAAAPVVQASPVAQSSPTAPVTSSTGGVLGAQITLTPPKPARHGVLGTVTNVAGATLPFTGFPIWFAVVIALALVLAGLALRRRGAVTRL
jgi:hypothetical protein